MADSYIQVPTDSTGKKVDSDQVTVSGQTVQRQRISMRGANAANSSVADSATSVTLKAANENRVSLTIVNDSTALLYVLKGSGAASVTAYTYVLDQGGTVTIEDYTGQVNGIWESAAGGAARVTEVTI